MTSSEDGHVYYLKYGGVAEDARKARYRQTHACTYMYIFAAIQSRALIQSVAVATIQERHLFRSTLAQVRLLFESGVYSRAVSIRSYMVVVVHFCSYSASSAMIHIMASIFFRVQVLCVGSVILLGIV